VVMAIALSFGQIWSVSLAIGLVFALSSTAIVNQTLKEKGLSRCSPSMIYPVIGQNKRPCF